MWRSQYQCHHLNTENHHPDLLASESENELHLADDEDSMLKTKQSIKKKQHYLPVIFTIFPGLLFFMWGLSITSLLQHCLLHLHTNLLALCLVQEPKIICGVRNNGRVLVLSGRELFPQSSCVTVLLQ